MLGKISHGKNPIFHQKKSLVVLCEREFPAEAETTEIADFDRRVLSLHSPARDLPSIGQNPVEIYSVHRPDFANYDKSHQVGGRLSFSYFYDSSGGNISPNYENMMKHR